MSLNLATLLRESAKKHPAKPAIHINDVTLPYGMLDGLAQRWAGALRGVLAVRPGSHVALLLPNVPQFTIMSKLVPALLAGGILTVLGTLSGHPAGFLVIAAGYALGQLSIVVAETRLQAVIRGPARATGASVSGLLSELCAIATFAAFAVGAAWSLQPMPIVAVRASATAQQIERSMGLGFLGGCGSSCTGPVLVRYGRQPTRAGRQTDPDPRL